MPPAGAPPRKVATLPCLMGPAAALSEPHAILTGGQQLEELASLVPQRYGDTGGAWNLIFWTALDGVSLSQLLRKSAGCGPCLVLIRDTHRNIFGAYVSELRDMSATAQPMHADGSHFYGSGETFLFALSRPADHLEAHAFRWSGRNRQLVCQDGDSLIIGAGGAAGLLIDKNLYYGCTGRCHTFENPPLTAVADGRELPGRAAATAGCNSDEFECEAVEVWSVDEHACRGMPHCRKYVQVRVEADGD